MRDFRDRRSIKPWAERTRFWHDGSHYGAGRTRPVFDRGSFEPMGPLERAANGVNNGHDQRFPRYRTAADSVPAKAIVTARLLKDPPPERAGRAPDCEESREADRKAALRRLMGMDSTIDDRGGQVLEVMRAERERLAPRRWRPRQEAAE